MLALITGAAGFVGSYLLDHLLDQPETEIVGVYHHDAPPSAIPVTARCRFIACDILAERGAAFAHVIQEYAPDVVYHLAGFASAAGADRDQIFRTNVDGTRYVLRACAGLPDPPRTLVVSTGYVYGNCDPDRPARETDPVVTDGSAGLYAASKVAAEEVAGEYASFTVVARAFNHTGPGQSPGFVIPAFARQIAMAERGDAAPVLRVGNLDAQRDFLDVRDVVAAYRLMLERAAVGAVYNVASGEAHPIGRLLDRLRACSSTPLTVQPDPDRLRPSDVPISVGDASRLRAETGWRPTIPLDRTLRDVLEYWRSQPAS